MAWAAAAGSAWPKMALPATNTDAPAAAATGCGVDVDAAVDLDGHGQAAGGRSPGGSGAIFGTTSAMNDWPPKPGWTVISSTRSIWSSHSA